jgi:hypothetical protein
LGPHPSQFPFNQAFKKLASKKPRRICRTHKWYFMLWEFDALMVMI